MPVSEWDDSCAEYVRVNCIRTGKHHHRVDFPATVPNSRERWYFHFLLRLENPGCPATPRSVARVVSSYYQCTVSFESCLPDHQY